MSLVEMMKAAGFKPEKSSEGEFKPLKGTYQIQLVKAEEKPASDKGGKTLLVEFKVTQTLEGDESKSKFNEFRKYLALEGEKATSAKKGLPWLVNALFTAGYEVDLSSDEAMTASIQGALGTTLYCKAYGFKPEDGDKNLQMFNIMKEDVATKSKR